MLEEIDDGAQLDTARVAELAGVTPSTVSSYISRGYTPAPDGRLGNTPWWWGKTIKEWIKSRPGQGARTDRVSDV